MPDDDVARLEDSRRPHGPVVVFDRPTSPGNIGTLARSADAFGASALVVTGHAADPYDPQAVRASTGSLFALTVLRVPGPGPVVEQRPRPRLPHRRHRRGGQRRSRTPTWGVGW